MNDISEMETLEVKGKPDMSHLTPAVYLYEGTFLYEFEVGDTIIFERNTNLIKNDEPGSLTWLDTGKYIVQSIDYDTGTVVLLSQDGSGAKVLTNPVTSSDRNRYYLPSKPQTKKKKPSKVAPEHMSEELVPTSPPKKRGRPKGSKNKAGSKPKVVSTTATKRGRGRPKGSKNRSKF
jgi:hypothetical protein